MSIVEEANPNIFKLSENKMEEFGFCFSNENHAPRLSSNKINLNIKS